MQSYLLPEFKIERDDDKILSGRFVKLLPLSHRPYGNLYAY